MRFAGGGVARGFRQRAAPGWEVATEPDGRGVLTEMASLETCGGGA